MSLNTYGSPIRKKIVFSIMMAFFFLVTISLFQMQILENMSYEKKSDENSIKKVIAEAPRGIFLDRFYSVVVSNKPSFTLRITPANYKINTESMLETVLSMQPGYIKNILYDKRHLSRYSPVRIQKDVHFDFIAWYEENSEKFPGVDYTVDLQRDYSFGVNGAHMFGYIKEISAELLEESKDKYMPGDFIGYNGIEKQYESLLHGEKGYSLFLVDSRQQPIGRYKDGLEDKQAVKGNDLVLAIDKDLQILAESAFKDKRGALVAIEPSTGEILAFVSAPTYDLSDFDAVTTYDVWQKLNEDKDKPLFNRASMSVNSPGSTFKIMNALIALEEGIITPQTTVNCAGGIQYGDRFFKCMHNHGRVNVIEAIEKSCNTFFYEAILKMDLDKWADYCRQFGFGKKINLDIGESVPGLVPDSKYYDRVYGKNKWTSGWTINLGIGQGELGVTVAQLAQYTALVANDGKSKTPHLVKGYIDSESREYVPLKFDDITTTISKKSFDIVKEGMFKVVNGEGSARNIRTREVKIAGKTGTAQNPHGDEHALFIAFAPYENPQIAVAVLVENVGFGSTHAAPIARDVILKYLHDKKKNSDKNHLVTSVGDKF